MKYLINYDFVGSLEDYVCHIGQTGWLKLLEQPISFPAANIVEKDWLKCLKSVHLQFVLQFSFVSPSYGLLWSAVSSISNHLLLSPLLLLANATVFFSYYDLMVLKYAIKLLKCEDVIYLKCRAHVLVAQPPRVVNGTVGAVSSKITNIYFWNAHCVLQCYAWQSHKTTILTGHWHLCDRGRGYGSGCPWNWHMIDCLVAQMFEAMNCRLVRSVYLLVWYCWLVAGKHIIFIVRQL